jgi:hypothetical protein
MISDGTPGVHESEMNSTGKSEGCAARIQHLTA